MNFIKKINKIALLHVIIIIAIYTMPIWLNWRLIIIYGILNLIQIKIFGGCVVSHWQFKDKHTGFYKHYIDKCFPKNKITNKEINIAIDYVLPIILTIIGFLIQK